MNDDKDSEDLFDEGAASLVQESSMKTAMKSSIALVASEEAPMDRETWKPLAAFEEAKEVQDKPEDDTVKLLQGKVDGMKENQRYQPVESEVEEPNLIRHVTTESRNDLRNRRSSSPERRTEAMEAVDQRESPQRERA